MFKFVMCAIGVVAFGGVVVLIGVANACLPDIPGTGGPASV